MERIYINPGHSDKDPGAVGYEIERKLNVKVSEYQKEHLLKNYVCEVRMNPGTMGNLREIANDANNWKATFFCSNHFNAGGGDGWEGLVYNNSRVDIGKVFEKHVKAAGQNSRGVKLRPGLAVLKYTNMPAILNEGAFVDNKKDIQDWNDDAELKKLGIAYAEATAEYCKLPKKVVTPEEPKETDALYRVQVGAYREKANAENMAKKLKADGYDAMIVKVK
jgi:N-acetylmuramoyl-L-alanine amidase